MSSPPLSQTLQKKERMFLFLRMLSTLHHLLSTPATGVVGLLGYLEHNLPPLPKYPPTQHTLAKEGKELDFLRCSFRLYFVMSWVVAFCEVFWEIYWKSLRYLRLGFLSLGKTLLIMNQGWEFVWIGSGVAQDLWDMIGPKTHWVSLDKVLGMYDRLVREEGTVNAWVCRLEQDSYLVLNLHLPNFLNFWVPLYSQV